MMIPHPVSHTRRDPGIEYMTYVHKGSNIILAFKKQNEYMSSPPIPVEQPSLFKSTPQGGRLPRQQTRLPRQQRQQVVSSTCISSQKYPLVNHITQVFVLKVREASDRPVMVGRHELVKGG